MPAGDIARMPAARRSQLIRTAAREFASEGYEHASLNHIIRGCGLSKSSFYHMIASKRDLFDLVIRDLAGSLSATIDVPSPEAFTNGDFWTRVERLLDHLMAVSETDEAFVALGRMLYLSGTPDDARSAVIETFTSVQTWLGDVLLAGRRVRAVRDDLPVALQSRLLFAILRTFDEWTLVSHDDLAPEAIPALVRAQLATVRRLLEP